MTKEIQLTQNQVAIVDDEDYDFIIQYSWHASYNTKLKGYYAVTNINNKTTYMHRLIMKSPTNLDIDHKNKNTLDNRKENLRICTRSQNQCNRPKASHNKSGYKGVWYDKPRGKWQAEIQFNNKKKHLGRFNTVEEAALYRDAVAIKLHGEFVHLNFPDKIHDHPSIDIDKVFTINNCIKTSIYHGVHKPCNRRKYQVSISVSNKTLHSKSHECEIYVALLYDDLSEEYHKEKSKLNFPMYSNRLNVDYATLLQQIHLIPVT